MELNVRLEGNVSQGLQPIIFNNYHPSVFSVPPQVKQQDSEKTKAEPERQTASESDTTTAIEQANKLMELFSRDLRFEMHKETGTIQISVIDRNDGKVIKQIPPDSVLNMIAKIKDMIGSLMDVKA